MKPEKSNLNIKLPSGTRLAIVGDIHEHEDQFHQLIGLINPSPKMLFVSVGDVYDKGGGFRIGNSIVNKIRRLNEDGFGFIVKGNHELKYIKRASYSGHWTSELLWLNEQPLVLSFVFENGFRITVLHGGVKPSYTWDDLDRDIETSYIRKLDDAGEMIKLEWKDKQYKPNKEGGVSWHETYDGRFGYIVAGHEPLKDGLPRFYKYSCNLDTACYCTGIMTCQLIGEEGLEELHSVRGVAYRSL